MNNTLENKDNWIGLPTEPLTGFSSKSGSTRHTTNVVFWSDVFLHERTVDNKTEKLAIILMDTQGISGTKMGTLLSSMQIFNLNGAIQENELEYLQMATDYAKFATDEFNNSTQSKQFQSLLFLMRDWAHPTDFNYGLEGGNQYMEEVLQVKEDQTSILKNAREYIKRSFDNLYGFLLPHPGSAVTNRSYDGRYADLDTEFVNNLKDLLSWFFGPEQLKEKRILGNEVDGKSYHEHIKAYFEEFKKPGNSN